MSRHRTAHRSHDNSTVSGHWEAILASAPFAAKPYRVKRRKQPARHSLTALASAYRPRHEKGK